MNKTVVILIALLTLISGCNQAKKDADKAVAPVETALQPGDLHQAADVRIAEDSPMLAQIKLSAVEAAEVPLDEVDAPGKIEIGRASCKERV